jgi:polyisoprenoid-binding protein YceI
VKRIFLFLLLMVVSSSSAFAQWELLNDVSSIHYVSVKKSAVAEVNSFTKLTGSVAESGKVSLDIDLSSVETNVGIRNERMKTLFFEIAKFVQANITGAVDLTRVSGLKVGDTYTETIKLNLSLHGISQEIMSDVQVTKLTHDRLLITSLKPVIISAKDYALVKGVEKLRSAANLPSISTAVPVTYSLVFKKQ